MHVEKAVPPVQKRGYEEHMDVVALTVFKPEAPACAEDGIFTRVVQMMAGEKTGPGAGRIRGFTGIPAGGALVQTRMPAHHQNEDEQIFAGISDSVPRTGHGVKKEVHSFVVVFIAS